MYLIYMPVIDRYDIKGHKVLESEAPPSGTGAHIYVPKAWIGETVKVVRVTDSSDE